MAENTDWYWKSPESWKQSTDRLKNRLENEIQQADTHTGKETSWNKICFFLCGSCHDTKVSESSSVTAAGNTEWLCIHGGTTEIQRRLNSLHSSIFYKDCVTASLTRVVQDCGLLMTVDTKTRPMLAENEPRSTTEESKQLKIGVSCGQVIFFLKRKNEWRYD